MVDLTRQTANKLKTKSKFGNITETKCSIPFRISLKLSRGDKEVEIR